VRNDGNENRSEPDRSIDIHRKANTLDKHNLGGGSKGGVYKMNHKGGKNRDSPK